MKVFLSHLDGGVVQVMSRPETPSGDVFGDMRVYVGKGEEPDFLGWTAVELLAMGEGEHDLEPKPAAGVEAKAGDWGETRRRMEALRKLKP